MPAILLGPLLRYVSETEATVWVETDAPCEVDVLGRTERTFHVEGHHYDNQISTLELDGRRATLRLERAILADGDDEPRLETVWERTLAPAPRTARMPADVGTAEDEERDARSLDS